MPTNAVGISSLGLSHHTYVALAFSVWLVGCHSECPNGTQVQNGKCLTVSTAQNASSTPPAGDAGDGGTAEKRKSASESPAPAEPRAGAGGAAAPRKDGTDAGSGGSPSAAPTPPARASMMGSAGGAPTSNAPAAGCSAAAGAMPGNCECVDNATRECGKEGGVCHKGTQTCIEGKWSMDCVGAVGMDSDACECLADATEACSAGKGVCADGMRSCMKGAWGPCTALMTASTERCDNLDNDCDGNIDETGATCDGGQKCMGGGKCVDCTADSECSKNTSGCSVGVCQNNSCMTKPLDDFAACTAPGTSGHCIDNVCTPTKSATVQDTDVGSGDAQISYTGGWMATGDIHYVTGEDATQCFSIRFTGTKIEIRGGRNSDRGIASYSLCDETGLGCLPLPSVDQYASTLLGNQQLVVQSGLMFGRYTIRGCATHTKNSASTGYIIDFDQAKIN